MIDKEYYAYISIGFVLICHKTFLVGFWTDGNSICKWNSGRIEKMDMKCSHILIMIIIVFICACQNSKVSELYYLPDGKPLYEIGPLNNCPIILVHGFGGFGRDELFGYKYWGGFTDIQEELKNRGYPVYSAAIGPFSSNWDRACELYAYIKGGYVDYGKAHSKKFQHRRFSRYYKGIYPQWGEINPITGKRNKIHLVAHSQGGQTSRALITLLEQGASEEKQHTASYDLSLLFKGGNHWVHSLTTLSTPHDGMTVNYMMNRVLPFGQRLVRFGSLLSRQVDGFIYDFKMDQWEIERKENETFWEYAKRLRSQSLWLRTKDTSDFDLSPEGAEILNEWAKAQKDVYYFSFATEETFKSPFSDHHYPEFTMDLVWLPSAIFMGTFSRNEPDRIPIDSSWFQNDGVVNSISMDGPTLGSTDVIEDFDGTPKKGQWNYMGMLESCDHADIIGALRYFGENCPDGYPSLVDFYVYWAEFLSHLPE
jgi:triacylglycerol lipase